MSNRGRVNNNLYTPEELALVEELWNSGMCSKEIARRLNRSDRSIRRKRMDLNLEPRMPFQKDHVKFHLRCEKSYFDRVRLAAWRGGMPLSRFIKQCIDAQLEQRRL
jgi:predicted HicB family RNase H-like nuclease